VGYSGGGTVAALIATRRNDVSSLTTIAANLDHAEWTRLHHISPLTGSLNAVNFIDKIENIDQLHFVGGKDKIVPKEIID
ncbi:MAG: alpha/beta hydrolase, partial [Candidatus Dadabacteria bacterium]|nr:alpha/beta hydrolase [Candidatus Dadabacteria bacterium]